MVKGRHLYHKSARGSEAAEDVVSITVTVARLFAKQILQLDEYYINRYSR